MLEENRADLTRKATATAASEMSGVGVIFFGRIGKLRVCY